MEGGQGEEEEERKISSDKKALNTISALQQSTLSLSGFQQLQGLGRLVIPPSPHSPLTRQRKQLCQVLDQVRL